MKIGLTGQIGAGKSSVAAMFKSLGASVVDADAIGKDVAENNPVARGKLVKKFGSGILTSSGALNRSDLAAVAFSTFDNAAALNSIIHPYLLRELRRQVREHLKLGRVVVVDAALLHYWRLDQEMDLTIVVYASRETRLRRIRARGILRADALRRERAQITLAQMKSRADIIVRNSGSRRELRRQAIDIWKRYIRPGR